MGLGTLTEKTFTILALLLFTGAVLPVLRLQGGGFSEAGDPTVQALAFGVYVVAAVLLVARWKRLIRVTVHAQLLWFLIGTCLISVLWSSAPDLTTRRGVALVGTTLFGVYFGTRFSMEEQLRLLGWTLTISGVLSVLFVFGLPEYGISSAPHQGAWRGVFVHKNVLGRVMVLGTMVFVLFATTTRRYWWLAWGGFLLCAGLVLFSTSKTALLILVALMAVYALCRILRWHYSVAAPFLIATVALGTYIALWVGSNFEPVLDALGKDATLTGRTVLWDAVRDMIRERPWFGYGYSGFWLGWEGPSAEVWYETGWEPPHSHNGYLDLWLALGFVGLLLFLLGFAWWYFRASTWIIRERAVEALWPVMFLTFMLLYNITESAILIHNSIFWVLYVSTVLSMIVQPERQMRPSRQHRSLHHPVHGQWADYPP